MRLSVLVRLDLPNDPLVRPREASQSAGESRRIAASSALPSQTRQSTSSSARHWTRKGCVPCGSNGAAWGVLGASRRAGARCTPTLSRSRPRRRAASTVRTAHPGGGGPRLGRSRMAQEGPGPGRPEATSTAGRPACHPLPTPRPKRGRVLQTVSSPAGPLPRSCRSRRRVNQPRHRPVPRGWTARPGEFRALHEGLALATPTPRPAADLKDAPRPRQGPTVPAAMVHGRDGPARWHRWRGQGQDVLNLKPRILTGRRGPYPPGGPAPLLRRGRRRLATGHATAAGAGASSSSSSPRSPARLSRLDLSVRPPFVR